MKFALFFYLFAIANLSFAGELRDLYFKLHPDRPQEESASDEAYKKTGIREIAIEHSGCWGSCPQYTAKISEDGTISYFGGKYASRKGAQSALMLGNFQDLARFIEESSFDKMKDSYRSNITDGETIYTSVTYPDHQKIISDYSRMGPTRLWAIEMLIEKVVFDALDRKESSKKAQQDAAANPTPSR